MARSIEELMKKLERLEAEQDTAIEQRKQRQTETAEIVSRFEQHTRDVEEAEWLASEKVADATKELVEE